MHGATIKIVNAQQAKLNNNYKNTKLKLSKTNATIWFNKMCKIKQLQPNYINIKINGQKTTRFKECSSLKMILKSKHVGAILNVLM